MSKIIKEMKELSRIYSNSMDYYDGYKMEAVDECIEIAKKHKKKKKHKGKCEWIKYNCRPTYKPKNHDVSGIYTNNFNYKYCPYCRKEIKVVESGDINE